MKIPGTSSAGDFHFVLTLRAIFGIVFHVAIFAYSRVLPDREHRRADCTLDRVQRKASLSEYRVRRGKVTDSQ